MPEYRSNPPSHNTGVGDILNDVDKDEKLGGSIQSNRGTERSTHGPFLAIQNFFETQQEISDLYNKKLDMVDVVANEVGFWNEETCNFNMDWNDYQFRANEAKEASAFAVYNRAWSYIKDVNIDDDEHQDALWEFNSKPLFKALNQAISYFESTEEYERCAFLVKVKEMKRALERDVPL